MNDITITITGTAGCGKTTLAQAISRALSFHHGIDVVVVDNDGSNGDDIGGDELEERLATIAERVKVHIVTQQQRRETA